MYETLIFTGGVHKSEEIKELIEDLAERSGIEDIYDFAGVLRIGKSSGGNLNAVIENSIAVIEEKISVKQEILPMCYS